jgi:hypothetical protein
MKYVSQVAKELGISYNDIAKIFIDTGYTKEDAEEFCCNKWSDARDMLLFEDEECFEELAKLFGLDKNAYKWQESLKKNKFSKRRMKESKRKMRESKFPSAQKNFTDFINKLQAWLDKQSKGLEVVEDNLGMGGAFIRIEQRDENGEIPEDGFVEWCDYDDADEYYRLIDND